MKHQFSKAFVGAAIGALMLSACQDQASSSGASSASSGFSIVGSSTVYPFAKKVAEVFGQSGEYKTPILESTGTGGGMEQFCAGVGGETPSITNASRRMKASEFENCTKNGVTDIVELVVGIDGIAIAQSVDGGEISLSPKQIYEALAAKPYGKEQTAKNWSDIDPSLPNKPIAVYGPPTTSGTRDAFDELMMEAGCKSNPDMKALKDSDKEAYEVTCKTIRSDGPYIEQGENDNLIVQKLASNPDHLGIFGYSYMEENAGKVRGIEVGGVAPTYDAIAAGDYPGARKLYIYIKKAHVGKVAGIAEFATMFIDMAGPDGDLAKIGLIALPKDEYTAQKAAATGMTNLNGADLK